MLVGMGYDLLFGLDSDEVQNSLLIFRLIYLLEINVSKYFRKLLGQECSFSIVIITVLPNSFNFRSNVKFRKTFVPHGIWLPITAVMVDPVVVGVMKWLTGNP